MGMAGDDRGRGARIRASGGIDHRPRGVEETGQALAGATVTVYARERPPVMNGNWETVTQVTTGKDGSYRVSDLPQRDYILCAKAEGADLLSGCQWGRDPRRVFVRPGAALTGEDLAIERGRVLEVDVKDPGEALDKNELKGRGVHLLVGVWGPDGQFHERHQHLISPSALETNVRLEVKGRKLDMKDEAGRTKLEADAPVLVREARSASKAARKFVVEVTGVKP